MVYFVVTTQTKCTMGKNTHFTGQPLFTQLLNLTDKQHICKMSRQGDFDRYVKKLDGYSHFVVLLYGILMRYDSLREIVIGMLSEAHKLQHLGIDYMVKRSTLSEANNRRDCDFFAKIYFSLYQRHRHLLADSQAGKSWGALVTYPRFNDYIPVFQCFERCGTQSKAW